MARRSAEPALVALDSSCLVAIVSEWHEQHAVTISAVGGRTPSRRQRAAGATGTCARRSLLRPHAAARALPPFGGRRVAPPAGFEKESETVALDGPEYWSLLRRTLDDGIYGGRIYDAIIAACARKGGARELLTLNAKHFEPFADEPLRVSSP